MLMKKKETECMYIYMKLQVYKDVTCRMCTADINIYFVNKCFPQDETISICIIPAKPELRDNLHQSLKPWHKSRKSKKQHSFQIYNF